MFIVCHRITVVTLHFVCLHAHEYSVSVCEVNVAVNVEAVGCKGL